MTGNRRTYGEFNCPHCGDTVVRGHKAQKTCSNATCQTKQWRINRKTRTLTRPDTARCGPCLKCGEPVKNRFLCDPCLHVNRTCNHDAVGGYSGHGRRKGFA